MTLSVAISLLDQGNTGNEILQILDALVSGDVQDVVVNEPTLSEIDF